MSKYAIYGIFLALVFSCGQKEGKLFKNPSSEETGITFANTLTETDDLNILDYLYFYNGGGTAIGDVNNDGLPDVFFSGNQVKNRLYLNKGTQSDGKSVPKFEDVTEQAGVAGNSSWNTGSVMGDVNGDGFLDIYVCAVVGINGFNGHNELYINNGPSEDSQQQVTFTESAAEYGLDFDSYSSSAAFLDYDLDGDLDMYLLNHAVHTQESYGNAEVRRKRNYQTGDKLLKNENGKFIDVSEEAGIYGGVNGYGLGVGISDFNHDGWPDIYVGNDFHEDDYYYLNNGDGTFTESLKEHFGHTSRFSMGNDIGDINHDGWPDLLALDMLPEDETVLKSSQGDDNIQTQRLRTEKFGYHYQFTRNMLNINQQNGTYLETALMSGIAATDWSWSALFADYNQDGEQDVFISNGIPKRPNDLDFINFASNEQIKKKITNTKLVDQQAFDLMPSGNTHNHIYIGSKNLVFQDKSGEWIVKDTLVSAATAWGDLDNDGDLDLITNNLNSEPSIYINKTNNKANYLKLKFHYKDKNRFGLGTKVCSYHNGQLQYKELYTVRGFQASSQPIIHFGYGLSEQVDSLKIVWPDGTYQTLKDIPANQTLTVRPENTKSFDFRSFHNRPVQIFEKSDSNLGIDFTHVEDRYIDFNRQKLMPYQISDRGPATALGDIDNDARKDIFFGGSKYIPSRFYIQQDSGFVEKLIPSIRKDSIKEDVAAVIADFDNNGTNDVFLGSGGGDFYNKMKPLSDSYYIQKDSDFESVELPEYFENASVIAENDFDQDGDLDLYVGNQGVTNDFGRIPTSLLLENKNGSFSIMENKEIQHVGMVTDAIWDDFDNDGIADLIVVGEWMPPIFFKNTNGSLSRVDVFQEKLNGLWQVILPFDIDNDGDTDYLLGNWGINTKFKASKDLPMKMYYNDFDSNGQTETVIAIAKERKYYPIEDLDGLAGQIVSLKKKFTTYKSFAGKTVQEIFDTETLRASKVYNVHTLLSGYLENKNGTFVFVPFQNELQISPLLAFEKFDFDKDGKEEVVAAGNYFGVKPYHGRFDSFPGALIKDVNNVILTNKIGMDLAQKSVRHLNIIHLEQRPYLLVTINNGEVEIYKLKQ